MNTAPELVAAGPILPIVCRTCGGEAQAVQWAVLSPDGVRTIGHTVLCGTCHPDFAWMCGLCPAVTPMDADPIYDHVRRHG